MDEEIDDDDDDFDYAVETDAVFGCSCEKDDDDLVIRACGHHRIEYSTERRIREVMDSEVDQAIFELFGNRRIERKEGAVFGAFAIDRKR